MPARVPLLALLVAVKAEALDVQVNADVKAEVLAVIPSQDGLTAAVVIELSMTNPKASLLWAPLEVIVTDASGNAVGTNNEPGADPLLTHIASLPAGGTALYVNDQILISGEPADATVTVGGAATSTPEPLAPLPITGAEIFDDDILGTAWRATVENTSGVIQEQVIVQAIVIRDGEVVAAGTAILEALAPGAIGEVQGMFAGDPTGGELTVTAPPSNVEGAGAPPREGLGEVEGETEDFVETVVE
jgi:hypothetical protein